MKPVIGITQCYKFVNYERAIKEHGGQVKKLMIGEDQANTSIDGLLLPGGIDIHPDFYHEKKHPTTNCDDTKVLDEFEKSLFEEAMEKDIPVFGICRGIQIMNVTMGGSLYQHIPDQIPEIFPGLFTDFPIHKKNGNDTEHEIKITTESRLSQIIGESSRMVNSSHHQAVKVISDKLVVTAQSKDGIIEAMEYPLRQFVIGVQYHPERMLQDPELQEHASKLFEAFIEAASGFRIS